MTLGSCDLDRREELRRDLRGRPDCRFIDVDEFEALIVSARRLERWDDKKANVRGLRDPRSGLCFLIEAEKVYRPQTSSFRISRN